MYNLRVIWVGKAPKNYIQQGIGEYQGKIKAFVKLESCRVKPADAMGDSHEVVRQRETEAILALLGPGDRNVVLDERGKAKTSRQLAEWFEERKIDHHGRINIIIGGAYGLKLDLLPGTETWSLSNMTLPHQLARLVLMEQIYRAFSILQGSPYHHD